MPIDNSKITENVEEQIHLEVAADPDDNIQFQAGKTAGVQELKKALLVTLAAAAITV